MVIVETVDNESNRSPIYLYGSHASISSMKLIIVVCCGVMEGVGVKSIT